MASTSQATGDMLFEAFLDDLPNWLVHPRAQEEGGSYHCQFHTMHMQEEDPEMWLAKYTGSHIDSVLPQLNTNQDLYHQQEFRRNWSGILKFVAALAESSTESWLLHKSTTGLQQLSMETVPSDDIVDCQGEEDEELRPSTAVDLTTGVSLSWIIGQQEEATGSFKISRKRVMADQPELPTRKDPVCGKRSKQKHYLC